MSLIFVGLFIIFISYTAFHRKRSDRQQKDLETDFWNREAEANHVRRQDISNLSYINIPFETFSIGAFSDEVLSSLEADFLAFQEKKMLSLGNQSNTDLKMKYGPANLTLLTEYDSNFVDMLKALNAYTNRLIELGHLEVAIPVLEFAVESGSDFTSHFTTLANYYKEGGADTKLEWLRNKAESLDSLMKDSILQKIK